MNSCQCAARKDKVSCTLMPLSVHLRAQKNYTTGNVMSPNPSTHIKVTSLLPSHQDPWSLGSSSVLSSSGRALFQVNNLHGLLSPLDYSKV